MGTIPRLVIEVDVEVEGDIIRTIEASDIYYCEGTRDYFDRGQDCWYPGDDAEFIVQKMTWKDTGLPLTDDEKLTWEVYVTDEACDHFLIEQN